MKRVISIVLTVAMTAFAVTCGGVTSTGGASDTNAEAGVAASADTSYGSEDGAQSKELEAAGTETDAASADSVSDKSTAAASTDSASEKSTAATSEDSAGSEKNAGADATGKDAAAADSGSSDNKDAYDEIPGIDMADINMFDEPQIMYVKSDVNIRKGPTTKYEIVGSADTGDEIKVIGQYGKAGWYYIEHKKGKAFVSNNYLLKDKEAVEEYQAQLAALAQQKAQEAAAAQPATGQQAAAAQPAPAQQAAAQPAQGQQAAAPQPTPQPAPVPQPAPAPAPAGTLFIGDSRCVQMRALVGQSSWICENSKGYEWLESKALGQADRIIGKGTRVVICLGVNDTENCDKYAALINTKAAEWAQRGARTYFVSVNPVSENPYRTEEEVVYFNSRLPGLLSGVTWIDTHSTLVQNGYNLVDGLHYNDSTNINIYNLIISQLK